MITKTPMSYLSYLSSLQSPLHYLNRQKDPQGVRYILYSVGL